MPHFDLKKFISNMAVYLFEKIDNEILNKVFIHIIHISTIQYAVVFIYH